MIRFLNKSILLRLILLIVKNYYFKGLVNPDFNEYNMFFTKNSLTMDYKLRHRNLLIVIAESVFGNRLVLVTRSIHYTDLMNPRI